MGCNCKGNKPQTKTKIINNETVIQPDPIVLQTLIGDEKPPFTRGEVMRAMDFLNGLTSSFDEKVYVYELHNKYHREQLQPSCAVCLPRIQSRIKDMLKIIEDYEFKNS